MVGSRLGVGSFEGELLLVGDGDCGGGGDWDDGMG